MIPRLPLLIGLFGWGVVGPAMAQSVANHEAAIDSILATWTSPSGPGAMVLVVDHGKVVFQKGYGLADVAAKKPIVATTQFLLGSVSKSFTAQAILLLADQGRLRLDDPLRKWIPEFPPYADSISLRQLLNHTSGLPDYESLLVETKVIDADWPRSTDTPPSKFEATAKDALAILTRQKALRFPPGDHFEYSNSGYMVLGQVVERASGQRYAAFLRDRIFKPLGMTSTVVYDETRPAMPTRARSYTRDEKGLRQIDYTPLNAIYGEDNVVTTAPDLVHWVGALEQQSLLSPTSWQAAWTPGRTNAGKATQYGFGWSLFELGGIRAVAHGGSWLGFRNEVLHFPAQKLTVVVLGNSAQLFPGLVAGPVAQQFLGSALRTSKPATVSPATLQSWVGKYQIGPKYQFAVTRQGAGIRLSGPILPKVDLIADSDSSAFVPGNASVSIAFTRTKGKVTGLELHLLESNLKAERVP